MRPEAPSSPAPSSRLSRASARGPPAVAAPLPVLGSTTAAGRAAAAGFCAAGAAAGFCAAGALGRCPCAAVALGRAVAVRAGVALGRGGGGGGGAVVGRVVGGGGGVLGAGVAVGALTVRLRLTAVPGTEGNVPAGLAGMPPTVKLTLAPAVVQPWIACTSTVYCPALTVPEPHKTPPMLAVTTVPGKADPAAGLTLPKKRAEGTAAGPPTLLAGVGPLAVAVGVALPPVCAATGPGPAALSARPPSSAAAPSSAPSRVALLHLLMNAVPLLFLPFPRWRRPAGRGPPPARRPLEGAGGEGATGTDTDEQRLAGARGAEVGRRPRRAEEARLEGVQAVVEAPHADHDAARLHLADDRADRRARRRVRRRDHLVAATRQRRRRRLRRQRHRRRRLRRGAGEVADEVGHHDRRAGRAAAEQRRLRRDTGREAEQRVQPQRGDQDHRAGRRQLAAVHAEDLLAAALRRRGVAEDAGTGAEGDQARLGARHRLDEAAAGAQADDEARARGRAHRDRRGHGRAGVGHAMVQRRRQCA